MAREAPDVDKEGIDLLLWLEGDDHCFCEAVSAAAKDFLVKQFGVPPDHPNWIMPVGIAPGDFFATLEGRTLVAGMVMEDDTVSKIRPSALQ